MLFRAYAVIFFFAVVEIPGISTLISYRVPITNEIKQALGYAKGSYLNYTEWTSSFGYSSEQHVLTTEDGYILTIFRTKSPNCTTFKTYPILLVHGILMNSDAFLESGVGQSQVYMLADQCYDVWVANLRGNEYSRAHVSLDPDKDAAFWRYSADEQGYYDLPATIDYILNITAVAKLNLIGFSLGGEIVVGLCADRPEYNKKMNLFIGIAPPTRNIHIKSITFRSLLRFFNTFGWVLQGMGIEEVFYKGSILQVVMEYICKYQSGLAPLVLGTLDFYDAGSVAALTSRSIFSHFFVGASVQQMAKAGQDSLNDIFSHYSFGPAGNLAKYGTVTAPAYNISNISVPTVLITGLNDPAVNSKDVHWLGQQLPNIVAVEELSDSGWNHMDNVYSQNIRKVQYPIVKKYLDLYNP